MKKKLIIVSNDGERKYATYLQQLVSALDDEDGKQVGVKDGSVDATIWDEKRFNDNEYAISSSNKILFVGWNDTANMNTTNMSDSFSACGMHYGRLGNRAYMRVEADSLNADNLDEFKQLCEKYGKTFEDELNLRYSPGKDEELGNKFEDHARAAAEAAAIPLLGPLGCAAAYAAESDKPTSRTAGRYPWLQKFYLWQGKRNCCLTCPLPPVDSFQTHRQNEVCKLVPAHGENDQRSDR